MRLKEVLLSAARMASVRAFQTSLGLRFLIYKMDTAVSALLTSQALMRIK